MKRRHEGGMAAKAALIVIDHGSRVKEANEVLEKLAARLRRRRAFPIIAVAHMELAMPDLGAAVARCVRRGASEIVIVPYFLAGGSHVRRDIPRLAREAAARFPGLRWRLAAPLGIDERLADLVLDRAAAAPRLR